MPLAAVSGAFGEPLPTASPAHPTNLTPPLQTHSTLQDCEDAAKWAGHEVIAEALLHPGASWTHLRCFNRELPPLDSLAQLDGVLISGSHYSAYEGGKEKRSAACSVMRL